MRIPKLSIRQQRIVLVNFMRKKGQLVNVPDYFTYVDEKYLMNEASDKWIKKAFNGIHCIILHRIIHSLTDALICPWCIAHEGYCELCSYGRVHGQCNFPGSTYQRLLTLHPGGIVGMLNISENKGGFACLWLNSITQARIQTELIEKKESEQR